LAVKIKPELEKTHEEIKIITEDEEKGEEEIKPETK
jgi:hypothetical protein